MTKPRIAAIVAAATLGAAAFTGAAVALAADDTPSPTAGESGPARGPEGHGDRDHGPEGRGPGHHGPGIHGPGIHGPGDRGPRGEMLHSEGVIESPEGTYVTVRMQQGEVTAASSSSITVTSADGYSSTYAIDEATMAERDGAQGAAQVGDTVHVRATVTGATATAEGIHALSPAKARELDEHRAAMEDWMEERPDRPERPEPGQPGA